MPPNPLQHFRLASRASCSTSRGASGRLMRVAVPRMTMATHSQHQPNLDTSTSSETAAEMMKRLEAELRSKAQPTSGTGGFANGGKGNVGPFPVGNGGRDKTWKKWRDLNVAGKLGRTTRQTGNLTVVILGGGLFVVLAIALSTELFAKNSPSVLYSQAVDIIRDSDALNPHLLPPLTFTHSPSSSAPSRGSTPIASQLLRHPTSGRDHLILRFFVHGRGKDEAEPLGFLKRGLHTAEEWGLWALDSVGLEVRSVNSTVEEKVEAVKEQSAESSGWLRSTFGSLSTLRSPAGSPTSQGKQRGLPPPGTYKSGEVKADYVKNAAGTYTLLTLTIDIPHSQAPHPQRAVIFRSPEAEAEGLLGGRYR